MLSAMPAEIDRAKRLDDIAVATLELAREHGPKGVTVRAVAARLGGSTTLVTKYLPNRPVLLANAFRYVQENWSDSLATALSNSDGEERVRALAKWSLDTVDYDETIRHLWIEALAGGHRSVNGIDLPQVQAQAEHDHIMETVIGALGDDAGWLADALFLAFRGYYLSSIEDPGHWPPERAFAAISRLLDELPQ